MNERSSLRRFVTAWRDFGFIVATKVAYSKVRGKLRPALALPPAPVYDAGQRAVSILLSTAEHSPAALHAAADIIARRGQSDWELCICERLPVAPEMARTLTRWRGTRPWIRIVLADQPVDDATAARWTLEQATGRFIAMLAPGYELEGDAIACLLAALQAGTGIDVALLMGTEDESRVRSANRWFDCRLLLQSKPGYLAALAGCWPLTAPALAKMLAEADVPTVRVTAPRREALD